MTRASTQDPFSVAALIPTYSRFEKYPIPETEVQWMQQLCDTIRANIGPLPLQIKRTPHSYIPFLQYMLRDMQAHVTDEVKGCRTYSLLPQKHLKPVCISISNTILRHMVKHLEHLTTAETAALDINEMWKKYFNQDIFATKGKKQFGQFIVTDGMSVSITYCSPKSENTAKTRPKVNYSLQGQRILGLDPGRKKLLTAVVHDNACLNSISKARNENVHNEVIAWSKGRFYEECGYTERNRIAKVWSDKNRIVQNYNKNIPTCKVADKESYKQYARFTLKFLNKVIEFYSQTKFKRLRWKTYIRRQKAYEKLCHSLTLGNRDTIIAFGDAGFASSGRGNAAVPTKTLRRKLGYKCHVVDRRISNEQAVLRLS